MHGNPPSYHTYQLMLGAFSPVGKPMHGAIITSASSIHIHVGLCNVTRVKSYLSRQQKDTRALTIYHSLDLSLQT